MSSNVKKIRSLIIKQGFYVEWIIQLAITVAVMIIGVFLGLAYREIMRLRDNCHKLNSVTTTLLAQYGITEKRMDKIFELLEKQRDRSDQIISLVKENGKDIELAQLALQNATKKEDQLK